MSRRPVDPDPVRRARYEALFREVYEPLQHYVRRRAGAGGADMADDVVAEALTVAWRRLDEMPAGMELPWCFGVARRCLANHRRSEGRRSRLVDRLHHERSPVPDDEALPDSRLAAALAELADDDREIVRLWAWEALAPREIAVVLGTTANAASIRLHRARRRLADAIVRKESTVAGHGSGGLAKEAR
jgi:RNA polymerase sigma-70 factor (ECF subfamily)